MWRRPSLGSPPKRSKEAKGNNTQRAWQTKTNGRPLLFDRDSAFHASEQCGHVYRHLSPGFLFFIPFVFGLCIELHPQKPLHHKDMECCARRRPTTAMINVSVCLTPGPSCECSTIPVPGILPVTARDTPWLYKLLIPTFHWPCFFRLLAVGSSTARRSRFRALGPLAPPLHGDDVSGGATQN